MSSKTTTPLTVGQKLRMSLAFTAFMLYLTGAGFFGLKEDADRASFKEVEGRMVHVHQYTGIPKQTKAKLPQLVTDLEYQYNYDSKTFTRKESSTSITDTEAHEIYAVGNKIPVFVDPRDPTNATLEQGRNIETDKITMGITATAALIGICISIFLFIRLRRQAQVA